MKRKQRGPDGARVAILAEECAYQGFFRLEKYRLCHSLFAGGMSAPLQRELFERGHAAAVLLYDAVHDVVVILEQFRIGALQAPGGPWLLEIVAGMIEEGEDPQQVARREAQEEAGAKIGELVFICDYLVSPGGSSERISLYCGQVDSTGLGGLHGLAEEDEDIRVSTMSFANAWEALMQGEINSASPIIALQWLAMNRDRLRNRWQS